MGLIRVKQEEEEAKVISVGDLAMEQRYERRMMIEEEPPQVETVNKPGVMLGEIRLIDPAEVIHQPPVEDNNALDILEYEAFDQNQPENEVSNPLPILTSRRSLNFSEDDDTLRD